MTDSRSPLPSLIYAIYWHFETAGKPKKRTTQGRGVSRGQPGSRRGDIARTIRETHFSLWISIFSVYLFKISGKCGILSVFPISNVVSWSKNKRIRTRHKRVGPALLQYRHMLLLSLLLTGLQLPGPGWVSPPQLHSPARGAVRAGSNCQGD